MKWLDKLRFSKKEQLGLIIVWSIIISLFSWFYFKENKSSLKIEPFSKSEKKLVDSLLSISEYKEKTYASKSKWKKGAKNSYQKKKIDQFNPNNLSKEEWIELGFSDKQSNAILKYKYRIKQFRSLEDLKKCFVINEYMYNRISGYVVFDQSEQVDSTNTEQNDFPIEFENSKLKEPVLVNSANASEFMKLKGIGPTLSGRIVKFRERLGGFYSINQINEVYGIEDSVFNSFATQLTVKNKEVKKVKINSMSYEELKSHPYIDWKTAKKIINYREDWHKIKDEKTLLSESIFTQNQLNKILPYLNFD